MSRCIAALCSVSHRASVHPPHVPPPSGYARARASVLLPLDSPPTSSPWLLGLQRVSPAAAQPPATAWQVLPRSLLPALRRLQSGIPPPASRQASGQRGEQWNVSLVRTRYCYKTSCLLPTSSRRANQPTRNPTCIPPPRQSDCGSWNPPAAAPSCFLPRLRLRFFLSRSPASGPITYPFLAANVRHSRCRQLTTQVCSRVSGGSQRARNRAGWPVL